MNEGLTKELLLNIVKSDTEQEVIDILKKHNLYYNDSAWRDFGDNENNYSTVGNQQGLPEVALVEKIVNSIDSILTLKCIEKGYDPESNQSPTPQTLSDAVEEFYNIKNGKLTELTPSERTKIAEKSIGIVASGYTHLKGDGSYSIFDFGEGQTPEKIPSTFMSIGASNKIKIPFVQGKFNQGGTGVFRFCKDGACQLVLTKRNPKLIKDGSENKWGFSIVRRVQIEGYKSSKFVYLVNPLSKEAKDNNVFSFNADSLKILPGKYPDNCSNEMNYGTYIKLFEYKLAGYRSNLTLDAYNRLSLLLPSLPIPVRLYERREGYRAKSYESTLNGLSIRLDEDRNKNLESENWPVSTSLNILNTSIPIKIYAFKELEGGGRPTKKYTQNEGVIFTINGQTHGHFNKSFFKRKGVNLSNLTDSLIVLVDCSNMDNRMREDLFMTSRDRLSNSGNLRKTIEQSIEKLLKNHEGLKELKVLRHQKSIENRIGDSKPFVDVVQNLMSKSPSLSSLFIKGSRISNPFKFSQGIVKNKFSGKEFPTFFKLEKNYPVDRPRNFPNNNDTLRIKFKTDVVNDYFDREKDPGKYTLELNNKPFEGTYFINLFNGTGTLNIELSQKHYIGENLKFKSTVSDISNMLEKFEDEFYIEIIEPVKQSKSNKKGDRVKPSDQGDGDTKTTDQLGLPEVIEVKKGSDNWNRFGFNDKSAIHYKDLGEEIGKVFYINMDNIYFLNELKHNNKIDPKVLESQYKFSNTLIALSIIKSDEENQLKLDDEYPLDQLIKETTSSISMILIPMITELGGLVID